MATEIERARQAYHRGDYAAVESICARIVSETPPDAEAFNLWGTALGLQGEHERAAEHFRRARELDPARPLFFRNLYRSLVAHGDFDGAEREVCSAMATFPAEAQGELATMLLSVLGYAGRLDEALALAERQVQAAPDEAPRWFALAEVHRRRGEDDRAIEALRRTLRIAPTNQDAWNNLAGLHMGRGEFMEALKCVQAVLRIAPRSAQANCNLASLLSAAGDVDSAIVAYRNALQSDPGLSLAKYRLASQLIQQGGLDEAERLLDELSGDREHQTALLCARARVLERRGEIEAAFALAEAVPEADRSNPAARLLRSNLLEQMGRIDEAAELLLQIIGELETPGEDAAEVHFTLGPLLESLARYEEAFEHIERGNRLRRDAHGQIDIAVQAKSVDRDEVRRLCPPDAYEASPASSLTTRLPIFIVGMPRSGTTLTEQILGRHSQVHPAGELTLFRQTVGAKYASGGGAREPLTIVDSRRDGGGLFLPKHSREITPDELTELGWAYLRGIRQHDPNAERITDKMPYNFLSVPLIHRVFPHATIIHCRRHPLDVCLSCYFQNFRSGNYFAFDLAELGRYYRDYYELMEYWRDDLRIPMVELEYEELVQRPEQIIRGLLATCGLDWEDACLSPQASKRVVNTASYQQVRKPIYTQSKGRWTHYRTQLTPLIESMGLDVVALERDGEIRFHPRDRQPSEAAKSLG